MTTTDVIPVQDRAKWRWFFVAAALEAGAAFVALALLPREGRSWSLARLGMLAILAIFVILGVALASRPPGWLKTLSRNAVVLELAIASLALAIGLFLLRYADPAHLLPYYERLAPLLAFVMVLGLEACLFILFLKYGFRPLEPTVIRDTLRPAVTSAGLLLLVFVLIAVTRIGLKPDAAYWGEPGVPVLGWQLCLALIAGLTLLLAGLAWRLPRRIDAVMAVIVWIVAVTIWLSVPVPVTRNSFYAPITPPDNQPYPNSDAGYYDSMAESLLIGHPYQGDIPTRPLYIVGLAGLHLLVGENYESIVVGQTLVLALIPVLMYFLGAALHSRAAGMIAALIAVFREWTTILVSSQTRVSDTRTLLVDLPTLLLILAACLLAARWLTRRDSRSALVAGGAVGLLFLLRTQSLLILPGLLLSAIVVYARRSRSWIGPLLFFLLGLAASVIPWLVHNYLQTGQLTFDAPFQSQIIVSQYQYTGNLDINNVDLQGKSVAAILITFLLHDPGFVLGFIATHFAATQIDGLLALPLFHAYAGLTAPMDLYWVGWDGSLSVSNLVLVIGYLAVIAIGLGAAWRRLHWAGMLPLVFSLGYSLANGVARFSGWRYDLPADWVWYFYFAIGFAQLLALAALMLGANAGRLFSAPPAIELRGATARNSLPFVAAFALVGALPWLAQGLSGPRYSNQDAARLISEVATSPIMRDLKIDGTQLSSFVAAPSAVAATGRLLYPRFFSKGLGLASSHPWPAYAPRDFPRLGFILLDQTRHDIVFPTRQLGGQFPQAADAIVLGCKRTDYIEARLVYFPALGTAYLSAPLDQACQ